MIGGGRPWEEKNKTERMKWWEDEEGHEHKMSEVISKHPKLIMKASSFGWEKNRVGAVKEWF